MKSIASIQWGAGVGYTIKSMGPRREPRETPHVKACEHGKMLRRFTEKVRRDEYDCIAVRMSDKPCYLPVITEKFIYFR